MPVSEDSPPPHGTCLLREAHAVLSAPCRRPPSARWLQTPQAGQTGGQVGGQAWQLDHGGKQRGLRPGPGYGGDPAGAPETSSESRGWGGWGPCWGLHQSFRCSTWTGAKQPKQMLSEEEGQGKQECPSSSNPKQGVGVGGRGNTKASV